MIQNIVGTLSGFSIIEWIGLITGVIYVILSAQNNLICWVFGIISCACIAYHDFFGGLKLYSDGILQLIYIALGFYGLYVWRFNKIKNDADLKNPQTRTNHVYFIILGALISMGYGLLMKSFTDASFPYIDAFTTVYSIIATVLLVNRQLSAWIYFIFIDFIMVALYYVRGFELYALLYFIFGVVAIIAVRHWRRLLRARINYLESI